MASDERIRIDHGFRRELGLELEGNGVSYCYQCGACVGSCSRCSTGCGRS